MKSNTIIVLALVAVFGYWAYTRYGAVSNLQFVPQGIQVAGGGFEVTLGVENTSNVSLQYNSFAGSLIVNGTTVGNISDFTPRAIAGNAVTPLTFNVNANLLGLATSILSDINSGSTEINSASIQGTANIGGTQYPVNVVLV